MEGTACPSSGRHLYSCLHLALLRGSNCWVLPPDQGHHKLLYRLRTVQLAGGTVHFTVYVLDRMAVHGLPFAKLLVIPLLHLE